MQKIVLYPHGGSGNHGCEALVRSTAKILGDKCEIILVSKHPSEDKTYGIDGVAKIVNQQVASPSFTKRVIAGIKYRVLGDKLAYERLTYGEVLNQIDKETICLSFGGDNYCYGKPVYIYIMNRLFRAKGAKTIFWGCSIEPDNIDDEMLTDLRGYDKIITREELTYQALISRGLNNVFKTADPAFALSVDRSVSLPAEFIKGNTVGINLSPMVMDYSSDGGMVMNNYRGLIRHIIENTDMNIALVPHVVWSDNDDRGPLKELYSEFKSSGRVCLIEDMNCERIKGVISQCRFLVAARTHASIAAYSTGVPTLVLGYSIKAKGIAQDLYGTYENYVVPVQSLKNEADLITAFGYIRDHESHIKALLNSKKDGLLASAMSMSELIC